MKLHPSPCCLCKSRDGVSMRSSPEPAGGGKKARRRRKIFLPPPALPGYLKGPRIVQTPPLNCSPKSQYQLWPRPASPIRNPTSSYTPPLLSFPSTNGGGIPPPLPRLLVYVHRPAPPPCVSLVELWLSPPASPSRSGKAGERLEHDTGDSGRCEREWSVAWECWAWGAASARVAQVRGGGCCGWAREWGVEAGGVTRAGAL